MRTYILGAGNQAREVLEIYAALGKKGSVSCFVEENSPGDGRHLFDKPIIDTSALRSIEPEYVRLIAAIGSPLRSRLIQETEEIGFRYETAIHPTVVKDMRTRIGKGTILCAGVIITTQAEIGDHVIINIASTISHDARIGRYSTISPGSHILGHTQVGERTFIGAGSTIIQNVSIGDRTFIGAGSVVTKDIPDDCLAFGVPAKTVRKLSNKDWSNLI